MGLSACISNNPCLWCKWYKEFFYKLSSIALPEIEVLKRNIEEQLKHINEHKINIGVPEPMFGYANIPIFDFINFEDCVFEDCVLCLCYI